MNPAILNRAARRRMGWKGHGALAPIDLGIKKYKRDHPGETKRVLYYKQEMRQALAELKENNNVKRSTKKDQSKE